MCPFQFDTQDKTGANSRAKTRANKKSIELPTSRSPAVGKYLKRYFEDDHNYILVGDSSTESGFSKFAYDAGSIQPTSYEILDVTFDTDNQDPGWQFNRLFVCPSFGPRIGLSVGPSVKLKSSYVKTAQRTTEMCKNISNRLSEIAPAGRQSLRCEIRVPIVYIFTPLSIFLI